MKIDVDELEPANFARGRTAKTEAHGASATTREQSGGAPPVAQRLKRPYRSPVLRELGSIAELTREVGAPSMLPPGHPAKPFGM